ncbi:nucleotidyl transferase AbiEii/AbiGii toxin family protein [Dactylosporangium aurantiacum]|uniref:Nucleotidyl transferase AbiEii/AbiGii toxin family protein n=1 Tax=Dactylosporangium aurantiacum TaxID=35754 RepID=A0A9Q9I9Z1_9ACTN|nr:nucleotidyl transferase AbiEii/AbiGii toxin family protein [Dactylosporangium aurantiacum]MDG6108858.1 nucleotidyl transferase AbiEii/AbiGii toxin family protein [Dactylosporangium aurantiacum]UWZ52157.1 nucleotidyl transferase AbiEii/AbiGii toxin family protein [Dactylosporangium aurantiacum]
MSDSGRAHRDVLDHVLAVVAADPVGDDLVLRGSMTMPAWVGGRARPPADLDWVVRPASVAGVDRRDPYPYLDRIDPVQYWPEATQGAGRAQPEAFLDEETGGVRAKLPPEGLRWMDAEEVGPDDPQEQPHVRVLELLERHPRTPGGAVLDVAGAQPDRDWDYAGIHREDDGDDDGRGTQAGARVLVPWRAGDLTGTVQLDFSFDEPLPEPPVLTAVPRGAGGVPTVAWTASRALSLLWKLQWIDDDQRREGDARGKDVYDAVLLAELDVTLPPRLRRLLPALDPAAVRAMRVDWSSHPVHDPDSWLDRLAWAVQHHCGGYETDR